MALKLLVARSVHTEDEPPPPVREAGHNDHPFSAGSTIPQNPRAINSKPAGAECYGRLSGIGSNIFFISL
jgi:hypothetical protein